MLNRGEVIEFHLNHRSGVSVYLQLVQQVQHFSKLGLLDADVVVTMGCGDTCPYYPGKRDVDWQLDDPARLPVDAVRPIVDEIDRRVQALLAELTESAEQY